MSYTYTYNRDALQKMQAEYRKQQIYQYIDHSVANGVLAAAREGKTKYFWSNKPTDNRGLISYPTPHYTNEELINALKEKFPDTFVEYEETWIETRPGVKEQKKGILIDWS